MAAMYNAAALILPRVSCNCVYAVASRRHHGKQTDPSTPSPARCSAAFRPPVPGEQRPPACPSLVLPSSCAPQPPSPTGASAVHTQGGGLSVGVGITWGSGYCSLSSSN